VALQSRPRQLFSCNLSLIYPTVNPANCPGNFFATVSLLTQQRGLFAQPEIRQRKAVRQSASSLSCNTAARRGLKMEGRQTQNNPLKANTSNGLLFSFCDYATICLPLAVGCSKVQQGE